MRVDGYGSFGYALGDFADWGEVLYNPVGSTGPATTVYESGVLFGLAGATSREALSSGDIGGAGNLFPAPEVTGTETTAASAFSFGGLEFSLGQDLTSLYAGGARTGSLLTQTYTITNNSSADTVAFDLVRYLDGDLEFIGDYLDDGGGRLVSEGTEFLFETDTATGSADSTTFLGITGSGGTVPTSGRYEIHEYSSLQDDLLDGLAPGDSIEKDVDLDQFIDVGNGYDVTLALRNEFALVAGGSAVYTTRTLFGSGAPETVAGSLVPEPGTLVLLGTGLAGLAGTARRRRTGR